MQSRVGTWAAGKKEEGAASDDPSKMIRQGLTRVGTWTGFAPRKETQVAEGSTTDSPKKPKIAQQEDDDRRIRFTIGGAGRRMTKEDFLKELQAMDAKTRHEIVAESDAPAAMKDMARKDASDSSPGSSRLFSAKTPQLGASSKEAKVVGAAMAKAKGVNLQSDSDVSDLSDIGDDKPADTATATKKRQAFMQDLVMDESGTSNQDVGNSTRMSEKSTKVDGPSTQVEETPAERRRRQQALKGVDDQPTSPKQRPSIRQESSVRETPAERRRREAAGTMPSGTLASSSRSDGIPDSETPAEKRRREAALGMGGDASDEDSDDDNTARVPLPSAGQRSRGIRFAEEPLRGRK